MPDRILVTYASRAGSTRGVAEAIGKTLAESGAQVDVRRMQDVNDLAPYRAVVAGSAIQAGNGCRRPCSSCRRIRRRSPEALRRVFGVYDAGHAGRRQVPRARGRLPGTGARAGEAGERGLLCRGAGHQQNAVVWRQAEVSLERCLRRLDGGRSPGLERHSRLGREHPSAAAPIGLTGKRRFSAQHNGAHWEC